MKDSERNDLLNVPTELYWRGGKPGSYALLYAKGIAMGMGDSVPGISGGTIAVITNIYESLIFSIRRVDLRALRLLLQGRLRDAWHHVNGTFLLLLAAGILSGLLLSANTVLYLLEEWFVGLMAFFVGLVLASAWLLQHSFSWRRPANLAALALGVGLILAINTLPVQAASLNLPYLFFCGAIAICAMILPGLSGAFILLLLGAYQTMLEALLAAEIATIAVFISGCVLGLLLFSRLLAWLLASFHALSYACIVGLLLGSLSVLWPWQRAVSFYVDSDGLRQTLRSENVSPLQYAHLTGEEPMLLLVAIAAVVGFALVLLLHRAFATVNASEEKDSR
ncbi:MAG: DUF368 domain-containing protein [Pseudohongiellaceae bacterium]